MTLYSRVGSQYIMTSAYALHSTSIHIYLTQNLYIGQTLGPGQTIVESPETERNRRSIFTRFHTGNKN